MMVPRPGGRTARTKVAVFEAAATLMAERGTASITMTEIADCAGVAATSLYRRWGAVDVLLLEVATEQLKSEYPLPDTGTLHGDLQAWGRMIAVGLRNPKGSAFFNALVATAARSDVSGTARAAAMDGRLAEIAVMLDRSSQRGERVPSVSEVIDYLLAPLFGRALFGKPGDELFAEQLVEQLVVKSH